CRVPTAPEPSLPPPTRRRAGGVVLAAPSARAHERRVVGVIEGGASARPLADPAQVALAVPATRMPVRARRRARVPEGARRSLLPRGLAGGGPRAGGPRGGSRARSRVAAIVDGATRGSSDALPGALHGVEAGLGTSRVWVGLAQHPSVCLA